MKLQFNAQEANERLKLWATQDDYLRRKHRLRVTEAVQRGDRRSADEARVLRAENPNLALPGRDVPRTCNEPHCTVRSTHSHTRRRK